jgi:8-oxo-dGTP pyrophosphatase MutT (NUDIX family)
MVIQRRVARALLIAERSLLLIQGRDPAHPEAGTWWVTPGGGLDDGESLEIAVVREVLEETGLQLVADQLGPVVATRATEFTFDGQAYRQREWYFAARVAKFAPRIDGWSAIEQRSLLDHRWWTLDELMTTDEALHPSELAAVFQALLDGTLTTPMELSSREA